MMGYKNSLFFGLLMSLCLGSIQFGWAQNTFGTQGRITGNPLIQGDSAEFSAGTAIENLCPQLVRANRSGLLNAGQKDLLVRCGDVINEGGSNLQRNAVRNMAPEEVSSQSINARRLNTAQLGNISARLAALRPAISQSSQDLALGRGQSHPLPELAGPSPVRETGGAAGDIDSSTLPGGTEGRLGVFVSGIGSSGEKDETDISSAFDYDSYGVTIGADYLLNSTTVVGAAIGYGKSDADFSNDGGKLETDTTTISVYATKFINESWFLDGIIGYGDSDYTNERNLNYTARNQTVNQTAVGEPSGDQLLLSLGIGRSFSRGIDIDVSGRVNYLDATVDRFSESIEGGGSAPGFGLALEIDKQEIKSVASDVNVKISKAFSQDFGVVVPHASLS